LPWAGVGPSRWGWELFHFAIFVETSDGYRISEKALEARALNVTMRFIFVLNGSNTRITPLALVAANGTPPAATETLKEVFSTKISRKIYRQVEAKIRYAIATGPLPFVERSPAAGTHHKEELTRIDANDTGHAR
jgi:hypothetical protein